MDIVSFFELEKATAELQLKKGQKEQQRINNKYTMQPFKISTLAFKIYRNKEKLKNLI